MYQSDIKECNENLYLYFWHAKKMFTIFYYLFISMCRLRAGAQVQII